MPQSNRDPWYDSQASQPSDIVTYKHGKFAKRGQNIQARLSPCSPHGSRKRLTFEDPTNGHQGEPPQLKKKPTVVLIDDNSRGLTEYHMIVLSPSSSTPSDSNIENPLLMMPSTVSQTFTAENSTLTERSLTSREKAIGQKTVLLKESLLPRNLIMQESGYLKEPLTLLEEASDDDAFVENPSIIGKKHRLVEEPDINTEINSVNKYTVSGKPPCQNEDFFLQDLNAKEDLVSTKLKNIENSKTEMSNPTKKSFILQKKCTIQKHVSCLDKPLTVKSISEKKLLIESVTLQNKPTTGKSSPFQASAALQEKHATVFQASAALQEKVTILKKPDKLQENIEKEGQFVRESLSFRKQYSINAFSTKETSLTEKGYITQTMMITHQVLDLRDVSNKDKNSHSVGPESARKSSTKEATVTKASLSLKEQQSTWDILSLEKKTSEEKSLCKKVLHYEEKPSAKQVFLPQDPGTIEENTTLRAVSLPKNSLTLQEKTNSEKESSIKKASTLLKKPITKQEFLLHVKPTSKDKYVSRKTLPVQEKTEIKKNSYKKFLTISEKRTTREDGYHPRNQLFSRKTPIPKVAKSKERQLSLKNNPTAQWKEAALKNHLAPKYHFTSEERAIIDQQLALRERSVTENETILQKTILQKEPMVLHGKHTVEEEAISKEPLTVQESLSHEVTLCKESLTFQERPTVSKAVLFKEALVFNEDPTTSKTVYMNRPLTYEENPIHMEDNTINDSLPQAHNNPNIVNRHPECGTRKPRVVAISNMNKLSFANKSYTYDSDNDPVFNTVYAKDIFRYMKEREEKFKVNQYMPGQADISSDLRAILVDWLVELQVTFEMSHETLYLAVKLIDLYLMEVICRKEKLQLLGSTAFFVAAKFEEPNPPCIEDFLYVCDDIYSRHEMINMEIKVLQTLEFDINIPIAYHFLRAYAKFVPTNKQTVTLSYFICELTLQNYAFIEVKASKLAAASYLLSLYINNLKNKAFALETCSGYKISELHSLVLQLNVLLSLNPTKDLKSIKLKYSHRVFFQVARTPPLNLLWLEKLMKSE